MTDQNSNVAAWKTNTYGVVAELMSEQVHGMLSYEENFAIRNGQQIKIPIPYFDHCFTSNREWYAQTLVALNILVPITNGPECFFVFGISAEDFYSHACAHAGSGPSFDDLLAAFLYHSIDFGGGFRVYRNRPFPVCKEYNHLFHLLAFDGYVRKEGLEYKWMEKAAKVLTKAHLWPIDDPNEHVRRTGRL
jgi:hypothetical protein